LAKEFANEGKNREIWEELCTLAATEQDPDRLLSLVREINRLLEEKEERLARLRKPPAASVG
jgi:hypothetical protein